MENRRIQILLDMDGVLVDFMSGAIKALNKAYHKDITLEQYATEFGKWGTYDYYGISKKEFWQAIENVLGFWLDLQPIPWYKELYNYLSSKGDVTITTAPSKSNSCVVQKYRWLEYYLNIKKEDVIMINKKQLLVAPGNILIDDSPDNVDRFSSVGGKAILVPSTWNTVNLTFEQVVYAIDSQLTSYGI